MDSRKVVRDFYREFEKQNLQGVLSHFAPHAMVHSPTLGKKDAQSFYKELFSQIKPTKVVIKDLFINPEKPHRVAAYVSFTFAKNDFSHTFDGVVIFELNSHEKIQLVEIIYDAQKAREIWTK